LFETFDSIAMILLRALLSASLLLGILLPRPPSFQYVNAVGCGDLFVIAWNKDSSEVLSVSLSGASRNAHEVSFDLSNSSERVRVRVDAFEGPESFRRCGDVGRGLTDIQDPTSGWLAVAGRLKLSVDGRRSIVTVVVDDLVVQSIDKNRVRAKKAIRLQAALHGIAG
jgi:hypothetical protein